MVSEFHKVSRMVACSVSDESCVYIFGGSLVYWCSKMNRNALFLLWP